jgi:hypothetical protein
MTNLRRRSTICAGAAVATLAVALGAGATPALATTYKAAVKAVPVGPYRTVAHLRGDATLVSVPGFSQLSIDLTRLSPRASYEFSLRRAIAAGNPCAPKSKAAGGPVAGWSFPPFVANAGGRGHGVGRATTFVPDPRATYYVDVRHPGGPELACGVFKPTASKSPAKPRGKSKRHRGKHKHRKHRRHKHKRHKHKHHRHKHHRHKRHRR